MTTTTEKWYKPHFNGKPNNFIKFSVSYRKAGVSWATSQQHKGGYYVTVVPVEKGDRSESFMAFSGFNAHLLDCTRRSKTRLAKAIELAKEKEEYFINRLKEMHNVQD